ncbi:MAG: ATP-dependent RNA helicase HrpA [Actinomycetota bacterium]|nr:ATP-dependent RNA helicase HrpA [Actinomycetota bacterium]
MTPSPNRTVDRHAARAAARQVAVPTIRYNEELPVTERRDDIAAAIAAHQVVIVAGETGSGKTTQLPKICLELGRGITGTIGHTQPRRLAARTVAERISSELDTPLGGAVGYKVRFTDQVSDTTVVKVMTDGILLAEIQRDRHLRAYDTLIIDEAHERSLNIDFLLGYLKDLLPRRPDLKVVITSATIDTARFAAHFDDAPVVEVTGRSYPVEVRYQALEGEEGSRDQTQAITDAVAELCDEGPGDILVFLSGEREIRDTADALAQAGDLDRRSPPGPGPEIVPLYARLPARDQHRVFQSHTGRRVVLATNVAETSLTVPGIRYVVDPGTARISRYSRRTKVQRLPIEAISQASANQRAGRCGRVAPGICIRLYTEEDFEGRPEFTEPEILRTNLASVILAMAAAGLGDIATFGFVDPPDHRAIADGVALLTELGALAPPRPEGGLRLTAIGRRLARLPVDPRLGRMVIEAEANGALREVTIIAAALSIQDPRERPSDKAPAAAESHARFADPDSDFVALLNLWTYLAETQRALSGNQFRKRCRAEFLNYLRVREWQDIVAQIRHVLRDQQVRTNRQPATADAIHRSVLAGLLSQIGVREGEARDFLGARQARFVIANGSVLAKKPPRWVMAGELVETNRLWARTVARIKPDWAERAGAHLVKRSYGEPTWDANRGSSGVTERVTLYGVPVVTARQVPYARIDSADARDLFIERGLVEAAWDDPPELVAANRAVLDEVRARRRSMIGTADGFLFDFYDQRLPPDVVSGRHFDSWWRRTRGRQPDLLTLTPEMVAGPDALALDPDAFPDHWRQGSVDLAVSYRWQPDQPDDGVTVTVPLSVLDDVDATGFDWQVPGLRRELVIALIRSLPKAWRRHVVPAPTFAEAFGDRAKPGDGPLVATLASVLATMTGEPIRATDFSVTAVPAHLRVHFVVTDRHLRALASGNDLGALRRSLDTRLRRVIIAGAADLERAGITDWDFGDLPEIVARSWSGHTVTASVTLVDEGSSVAIRLLEDPEAAARAMAAATRRLLLLTLPSPAGRLVRHLQSTASGEEGDGALALLQAPGGDSAALAHDCVSAAVTKLLADHGGPVRTATEFAALRTAVRADLPAATADIGAAVGRVLAAAAAVDARLPAPGGGGPTLQPSLTDVRRQVAALLRPGFVSAVGASHLGDVTRYLTAAVRRLETLASDPTRDQMWMLTVLRLQSDARAVTDPAAATAIRWMIEELRVSFWAQSLGTPGPVSESRIRRAIATATPATAPGR